MLIVAICNMYAAYYVPMLNLLFISFVMALCSLILRRVTKLKIIQDQWLRYFKGPTTENTLEPAAIGANLSPRSDAQERDAAHAVRLASRYYTPRPRPTDNRSTRSYSPRPTGRSHFTQPSASSSVIAQEYQQEPAYINMMRQSKV